MSEGTDAALPLVAIDGPSGSGKSTVARAVAARLALAVLDTGAMYRAVTLLLLEVGADPADPVAAEDVARSIQFELGDTVRVRTGAGPERDVSAAIRDPEVTAAVSAVAAHPGVRKALVAHQRAWARARGGGVVEGRDIGTVVFPDATVKVYLTASDDERARRRQRDEAAASREVQVEQIRDDLDRRDRLDSSRSVSPLVAAPDALVIDTTTRTVEGIVDEIVDACRVQLAARGSRPR